MPNKDWRHYPKMVFNGSEMVPYLVHDQHKNDPVGTRLTFHVSAPGCGKVVEEIVHRDNTGFYTRVVSSTVRELTPAEVY